MTDKNFFISTYLLSPKNSGEIEKLLEPYYELNLSNFKSDASQTKLQNLKNLLIHAKENEDDAILVIEDIAFLKAYDTATFFEAILEMAKTDFHFLGMDISLLNGLIQVSETLYSITNITNIKAFALLYNCFDFLIALIDEFAKQFNTAPTIEYLFNVHNIRKIVSAKIGLLSGGASGIGIKNAIQFKNTVRINLIIPFRNVEKYILECCNSILSQTHTNYRVYFIDDCSSDNSSALIPKNDRFIVEKNDERKYALQNIHSILTKHTFDDEDVIAILDGDDTLMHNYSLEIINNIYTTGKTLISYGEYSCTKLNQVQYENLYSESEFLNLRTTEWKASPLRTFKFELYKQFLIQDPDLEAFKNSKAEIYQMTYDMALMVPLLEIAGFERTTYNPLPIYYYRLHDDNDHKLNRELQYETELEIRRKRKFFQSF